MTQSTDIDIKPNTGCILPQKWNACILKRLEVQGIYIQHILEGDTHPVYFARSMKRTYHQLIHCQMSHYGIYGILSYS